MERSFQTAQDRLVKLMRAEGITSLAAANQYLETHYLPECEVLFSKRAACADDAHRPLSKEHRLEAILCRVEQRVVTNDYTFRFQGGTYQISRERVRPRLRGATVRVEQRRNGEVAARFEGVYLPVRLCDSPQAGKPAAARPRPAVQPKQKSKWMEGFSRRPAPTLGQAIAISNATS